LTRIKQAAGHQIPHEAPAQQRVIAERPGALHSLPGQDQRLVRLADKEVNDAQSREEFDEQPVSIELAGQPQP
jgi:hypothetical protein